MAARKVENAGREWTASVNGTGLRVGEVGSGAETVVFSPALFTNRELFAAPVSALRGDHRCIRYDHRGQGDSGFGAPQADPHRLGVEGLYEDAVALLDQLQVESCHWVGVSIGAMVGMRVAARHPERVRSLTLIGVSVRPVTRLEMLPGEVSLALIRATRPLGPVGTAVRRQFAGLSMRMMFGSTFVSDPARAADREFWRARFAEQFVPEGAPMLRQVFGFSGNIEDPGAEVEAQKALQGIPGARLQAIPGAGHTVLIEQPDVGTAAITEFLREVEAA